MVEKPKQVMSDSREQILNRVRAALAPLLQRAPLPEWERELVDLRGTRNSTDLWALFAERLKAVNGTRSPRLRARRVARIQRLAPRLLRSRPLAEAARGVFPRPSRSRRTSTAAGSTTTSSASPPPRAPSRRPAP